MDKTGTDIRKTLERGLEEIEQTADEIRVRLHLAGMDAKDAWNKLEPRLDEARQHARAATEASREAIEEIVDKLRRFRDSL